LLSADPYCARKKREGSGVFINYLGHACVLIEWNGISILTDPCIGLKPVKGGVERFTYKDLPEKLDYVLITHNHHDHFCLESLLRLRHKIDCLVVPRSFGVLYGDLSLKLLAKKVGFKNVVELETLESIKLSDGEIIAIPFMGEHADLSHGKTAYVVRAGSTQTLFAADSDCLDVQMYQHIYRVLGPIQTVFLGMECVGAPLSWSCGAFLPCKPEHSINQSRRYKGCDSTRGLSILEAVGAQRIYIYAMGLEPWLEYLLGLAYTAEATQIKEAQKLLSAARERGFSDAQLLTNKAEIHLMNHA
jgi:L-ascorbate metabolism protein UlaG (beta-lactamase superfamily)